jgi:hypothetical protein
MSAALATAGRFAYFASRALRNVLAAPGDDATTTPVVPIFKYMMGPYLRASAARPACGAGPTSGSAPRIGSPVGPGGRWPLRLEDEAEEGCSRERSATWRRRQRKAQETTTGSVHNAASCMVACYCAREEDLPKLRVSPPCTTALYS